MNLDDLLYELRNNILHDRSDQVAGTSDQLWSDRTLIRYINEAQRRFARRALVIRDFTTPQCCQITLENNVNEYPLDPSVIAVMSARVTGDNTDLARASHSSFDTYWTPDAYFFNPQALSALPPGKTVAWASDEGVTADSDGTMRAINWRAYPVPTATQAGLVVNLRVVRLPLNTLSDMEDVPEVPEDYHLDMLDWAAYLALRIVDVDAGTPDRAKEFKESFEEHVQEALKEFKRKTFTPMQWAFGRNGFSYEK